jgi:hypothetical protein
LRLKDYERELLQQFADSLLEPDTRTVEQREADEEKLRYHLATDPAFRYCVKVFLDALENG